MSRKIATSNMCLVINCFNVVLRGLRHPIREVTLVSGRNIIGRRLVIVVAMQG